MSTQIDPLTGLPMVFDSIIEQIPLDAQIFPYADLGATARPTAPPLYPDSIIPVSAFLSGQHPDTGSAQTVATNGDHDLRVHVTNAASGGGASVVKTHQYDDTLSPPTRGNFLCASPLPALRALWGLHYVIMFYPISSTASDHTPARFYAWLTKHGDTSTLFHIAQGMFLPATLPDMNKGWIEQEHWFATGQDPSEYLGVTDGVYDLWCRCQITSYDFEFMIKYQPW